VIPQQIQPLPESMSFVSHLRETIQQLRNALSSLTERHNLLRDQHHRQLLELEEQHRRAMQYERRELEAKHEKELQDVRKEERSAKMAADLRMAALVEECQRLRKECKEWRQRDQRHRESLSEREHLLLDKLENTQSKLLELESSQYQQQQQQQQAPPRLKRSLVFDLEQSMEEERLSRETVQGLKEINASIMEKVKALQKSTD